MDGVAEGDDQLWGDRDVGAGSEVGSYVMMTTGESLR